MIRSPVFSADDSVDSLLFMAQYPVVVIFVIRLILPVSCWHGFHSVASDFEDWVAGSKSILHLVEDMIFVVDIVAIADHSEN
jgi:hypothetical protein